MKKEEFLVLATRFLSREASADESEQLNLLLKQKKYSILFNLINEKWEKAGYAESLSRYNADRGIILLTAKILKHDPSFLWEKETKQINVFFHHFSYVKAAASLAFLMILITGVFFVFNVMKQRSVSIAWNERKRSWAKKVLSPCLMGQG